MLIKKNTNYKIQIQTTINKKLCLNFVLYTLVNIFYISTSIRRLIRIKMKFVFTFVSHTVIKSVLLEKIF